MEIHLSRIVVLFATFSFTALGLSATPLTFDSNTKPILDLNVEHTAPDLNDKPTNLDLSDKPTSLDLSDKPTGHHDSSDKPTAFDFNDKPTGHDLSDKPTDHDSDATPNAPDMTATSISTDDHVKIKKQFKPDGGARLILYNGKEPVWDIKIKDTSTISLSLKGDGNFTLSNTENGEKPTGKMKPEDYHGKMVTSKHDDSPQKTVWLVGADGKRRLIHDQETYHCLKGIGLGDPIPVCHKTLGQLPNIEHAHAICGTNRLRTNEALEKGSYLQAGAYKLLLTGRDLILTKNGNQIWANNQRAVQLILQADGNLVAYNCHYKPVWASRTEGRTPGFLFLGEDGSLRLYDGKKKSVWEP